MISSSQEFKPEKAMRNALLAICYRCSRRQFHPDASREVFEYWLLEAGWKVINGVGNRDTPWAIRCPECRKEVEHAR